MKYVFELDGSKKIVQSPSRFGAFRIIAQVIKYAKEASRPAKVRVTEYPNHYDLNQQFPDAARAYDSAAHTWSLPEIRAALRDAFNMAETE